MGGRGGATERRLVQAAERGGQPEQRLVQAVAPRAEHAGRLGQQARSHRNAEHEPGSEDSLRDEEAEPGLEAAAAGAERVQAVRLGWHRDCFTSCSSDRWREKF